ncbi:cysteine desulfurase family protein [Psychrobacillus sp. NPDC058041]|uniref:cysteine desulfurase family protein n=1 Tax=Psychrobacillus sp. NPDC058041 TaxID=3346310 RepID=UPI0036DB9802
MNYLDYAASMPMTENALATYLQAATYFTANPSSPHDAGNKAALLVEQSRQKIAQSAHVNPDGVYFTGSGTEGNLIAIMSIARALANRGKGKHIITSMAEHTSVHAAMNSLEIEGFKVTRLPFTEEGIVSLTAIKEAITEDTILLSIQHVNPEIGSIQPIEAIAQITKQYGVRFHVDCVQSFGKLPLDTFSNDVDAMTFSAHKIGGPKGCGAIYINPRCPVQPLFPGLTHEKSLRGGTIDTPAIAAFAVALQHEQEEQIIDRHWTFRRRMQEAFRGTNCTFVEAPSQFQFPSVCGMRILGMEGQLVMLKLNELGIYISTGSACDVNSASGTKAILAMGYDIDEARQFFRISFGPSTSEENIEHLIQALLQITEDSNH